MENRYLHYNKNLDYIAELEEKKKVFVIRPVKKIEISRLERNREKIKALYKQGYSETIRQYNNLMNWINSISEVQVSQ
ncbi:conserved protein with patatin domain [Halothermothrix orenii H 168]|uniref:Conserved protein with patatin domain n=1 Tax=Halothermothrix orenii (strain H 168 / OCM 544 / DSM 9562) TaxID=373903 RepID=B8CWD8_HALOH|nr:DUF6363 domain-containing protein [Halothermothrix orenii]ACL69607.1 conserved protein with patatin domain [Halothermothrix orenii H 168]